MKICDACLRKRNEKVTATCSITPIPKQNYQVGNPGDTVLDSMGRDGEAGGSARRFAGEELNWRTGFHQGLRERRVPGWLVHGLMLPSVPALSLSVPFGFV